MMKRMFFFFIMLLKVQLLFIYLNMKSKTLLTSNVDFGSNTLLIRFITIDNSIEMTKNVVR